MDSLALKMILFLVAYALYPAGESAADKKKAAKLSWANILQLPRLRWSAGMAKIATEKIMDSRKPKPKTCPLSCESYITLGPGVPRCCLAGHWKEGDPSLQPLLLPDTLEPVIPPTCKASEGDALLADLMQKARKRGSK